METIKQLEPTDPDTIRLDEDDIRTGLEITEMATVARAQLQTAMHAEQLFARRLYSKYGIDPAQYQLTDWITGFKRVEVDDGNRTD